MRNRACCPTCGQNLKAARVPRSPKSLSGSLAGPVDTSEMTDKALYAHYKRTALIKDLAFYQALPSITPALWDRCEAITKPTKSDLSSIAAAWRIERLAADPHWLGYPVNDCTLERIA